MICDPIRDMLSSYIDDQLSADERKIVEDHLAGCPDCVQELAMLRQTVHLTQSLEEIDLPHGFHASLQARLAQASAEAASETTPVKARETVARPATSVVVQ
jgi:anti-sigma factor RsiW